MQIIKYPKPETYSEILARPQSDNSQITESVQNILKEVEINGDKALKDFTLKFDKVNLDNFLVSKNEFEEANLKVTESLKKAINFAKDNIWKFHSEQFNNQVIKTTISPGILAWKKKLPIQKVGLYIPGGTAPLISTVLMLGIPAKIADCQEISLFSPASGDQKINSAILYTANLIGIKQVYKLGGTQAIAAMAYGTQSISKVDKIFGPGNAYVTKAKEIVQATGVAIDMPAGPSEVMVIADKKAKPDFVASDLLSQLEHGTDSQAILLSDSDQLIQEVAIEIQNQIQDLSRQSILQESIKNLKLILLQNIQEAINLANIYASEHLLIQVQNPEQVADKIQNAGSIFLGSYSPESAGDYLSGPNHTLPTSGFARSYSGLSVDSFCKTISYQRLDHLGLQNVSSHIQEIALAEGLDAHWKAVEIRLKNI